MLLLSIGWTGQQKVHHDASWSITSTRPLYAHIQKGDALVEGAEIGHGGGRGGGGFACLLVLLPR